MSANDDGVPRDKASLTLMIHALVDGELDAVAAVALERRIATDTMLAAEHRRISALHAAVKTLPRPQVAEAFLDRIAAIGEAGAKVDHPESRPAAATQTQPMPSRAASSGGRSRWSVMGFRSFELRALAASIVVSAVLASGATQWLVTADRSDSFAVAAASGHRRSLLAATPVDVLSSDRHTVKPWLNAKLGLSPAAPDLAKDGFALVGGRVEVIGNRPMPALVYRHKEHLITLVAEPQNGGAATDPVDISADGFFIVRWTDPAFTYWAISDMERSELEDFAAKFRAAAATM